MITNPSATTVLCYGDSNTHGVPSDDDCARLPADMRWTGRLQLLLGDGYSIIEEGLSGRTTDVDYDNRPGCNGRSYFAPCLRSHHPLDVVVIMLGSNDLKAQFGRSAAAIAAALTGYLDDIAVNVESRAGGVPRTVLVSPILLDDTQPAHAEMTGGDFGPAAVDTSRRLAAEIRRVAQARGVLFADAATAARAGADGLHLSLDSHQPLAELVGDCIGHSLADPG